MRGFPNPIKPPAPRAGRLAHAPIVPLLLLMGLLSLWGCTHGNPTEEAEIKGTPPLSVRRVACVGDSLTYGAGLKARDRDAYPAQLGRMLGPGWEVRNFGWCGTTALTAGKHTKAGLPYREQPIFDTALAFEPHVVIMQFGTNDADPVLWKDHKQEFKEDYRALIHDFAALPTHPKIRLCLPTPLVPHGKNLRLKNLQGEVLPRIEELAKEERLSIIDFFTLLDGRWELFPDRAHPDAEGARLLAGRVYEALTGKTFEEKENREP